MIQEAGSQRTDAPKMTAQSSTTQDACNSTRNSNVAHNNNTNNNCNIIYDNCSNNNSYWKPFCSSYKSN
ncbi:MAG: hypothetical protein J3R72DRAFT_494731 [Linnemannia gamsii]|nr:MAG: hypothetical protein J3R72DRAFT_494731 [Linnemannia gamsii]